MKKVLQVVASAVMMASLVGCSSATASTKASTTATSDTHTYSEKADAEALNYVETEFHGVTVSLPEEWPSKKNSKQEQIDCAPKGAHDKVELVYTEAATADEKFSASMKTTEPLTITSCEETTVNGITAFKTVGTSIVYDVIQIDAPVELYSIQAGEGVVTIVTIHDPEADVDMTPVFEKILTTVKVAA